MKITIRLITSIVCATILVAFTFTFHEARREKHVLIDELNRRGLVLSESLQETIEPLVANQKSKELARLVERFGNRERLVGVVVYGSTGDVIAITKSLAKSLTEPPPEVRDAMDRRQAVGTYRISPS